MTKMKLQPQTSESEAPDAALVNFGDWIARLITHPDVPDEISNAVGMVVVNIISNHSGYHWSSDAEGLRFMLPRLLFHMNEEYAEGCIHTLSEMILSSLPEELRREFQDSRWLRGGEQ
jgi:hypothetical protein